MPIIRQPTPRLVCVKKQHLLLLAEHLEKLADTPGALPEPLPMLYLHIAAALARGCRSQMTEWAIPLRAGNGRESPLHQHF